MLKGVRPVDCNLTRSSVNDGSGDKAGSADNRPLSVANMGPITNHADTIRTDGLDCALAA
jgi:hypothetical protein